MVILISGRNWSLACLLRIENTQRIGQPFGTIYYEMIILERDISPEGASIFLIGYLNLCKPTSLINNLLWNCWILRKSPKVLSKELLGEVQSIAARPPLCRPRKMFPRPY